MANVDIYDAAMKGDLKDLKKFYKKTFLKKDINSFQSSGVNLLCYSMYDISDENKIEKIRLIEYLIEEGIDVNFQTRKSRRNALHFFYFNEFQPPVDFENWITELLIKKGIDVNCEDEYEAIPMKYAITNNNLSMEDNELMYKMLLDAGSDYTHKDKFGKSCIDYAKEYSWRSGVLELIKEANDK
ncbi:ankyrin repeat domain-containing protein [Lactobacillus sp. YT155]|uniref:ankyrin repeat domain-containing protein n=1 Tax=Lactobacillus sp. YT155 TaxID=3060955 RepID=UPI00265FC344|nr:ankyrin repeat domain-containing protein [Lactobacillus sp. YT155]MDO1605025.1 ankyrin repeat domain-containing protein [Lactobacillus sp. YT155]